MHWRWYVGLGALVLSLILIVQNFAVVGIRFLFWSFDASLIVVLLLVFCAGALTGWGLTKLLERRGR